MEEESYNEKFKELTKDMAVEGVLDQLMQRAQGYQALTVHCALIYKLGRRAGLPRRTARFMAREFFRSEITPENYYPAEGER